MRWWFFLQVVVLAACGAWVVAGDLRDPAGPVWLVGALIAWVAARVSSHFGALKGALVSQVLFFWGPQLYAASMVGRLRCCICGEVPRLVSTVVVGSNVLMLVAAIGVTLFRRRAHLR